MGHSITQSKHPINFPEEEAELTPVSYYVMFIWLLFMSIVVLICLEFNSLVSQQRSKVTMYIITVKLFSRL